MTSLSRRSFRMFRSLIHVNRIYNTVNNLIDDKCDMQLDDVLITSVGILEDFLLVIRNAFITLSTISISINLCSRYKYEQSLSNSTVYTHAEQFLYQSLIDSIFITSYPYHLFLLGPILRIRELSVFREYKNTENKK